MKWVSKILGFLLIFIAIFWVGNKIVFGVGYTQAQIEAHCPGGDCSAIDATNTYSTNMYYAPGQTYSGFYQAPNGLFYPIGVPPDPVYKPGGGGGSGPADDGTGACTGIYDSCTPWTTCSATCGSGTQNRACFDTGCGTLQNQSQACNTLACSSWTKLKDSSFISTNSLTNRISLVPVAYDADDTAQQYFIVGTGGVVAAPAIDINISNLNPTAKTGDPEYNKICGFCLHPRPASKMQAGELSVTKLWRTHDL